MWKLLLDALLGRRRVRKLRRLLVAVIAAVMILAPATGAAILRTWIRHEAAHITPVLEQIAQHLDRRLDQGRPLRLPRVVQHRPHA